MSTADTPLKVVVAEDSVLLREGLVRLLEDSGFEVAGQAGDAEDLLRKVGAHKPDVAVIDVRMPPSHTDEGLRAARKIRADHPGTGVLVLSPVRRGGLRARPAVGVDRVAPATCSRTASPTWTRSRTPCAASPVAARALDPEVVALLLGRRRREDPLEGLTAREREVLGLMAEGRSNAAIAEALVVTERAVEKHVTSIFSKLDLTPTVEDHRRVLAVLAYLRSLGLAPPAVTSQPHAQRPVKPTMLGRMNIVSTADLRRTYGEGETAVHALAGVTLSFPAGQFTAIMGPSGSGKSTLMHLLAGLDKPTSGSVVIDGQELAGLDDKGLTRLRRDRLGFVFQAFNLVPVLTAEENITLPLHARRPRRRPGVARPADRHRRPARPAHAPARRALRRPAAARRGGARARAPAGRAVRRRADRQPGLARLRGGARACCARPSTSSTRR